MHDKGLGMTVEIQWMDPYAIELHFTARNHSFAGAVDTYVVPQELADLANAFRGFPSAINDRRYLELGNFDAGHAGGGARFQLHRMNLGGHVTVEVQFNEEPNADGGNAPQSAKFNLHVEPAAIDRFVGTLDKMPLLEGASAHLTAIVE